MRTSRFHLKMPRQLRFSRKKLYSAEDDKTEDSQLQCLAPQDVVDTIGPDSVGVVVRSGIAIRRSRCAGPLRRCLRRGRPPGIQL